MQTHKFPDNYLPSVYEGFSTNLIIDNKTLLVVDPERSNSDSFTFNENILQNVFFLLF